MTGQKILLVDDKPNLRKLGTAIFETGGYEIICAADGAAALELLDVHNFALLITDILMPNMDGYTLCYTIRNSEKHRDLPIIVYSATYTTKDDGVLANEVGADLFIRKPASMGHLLDASKELMERPRRREYGVNKERALADVTSLYNTRLIDKLEDKNLQLDSAQNKLVKSEARFRALVENSLDLISMIDESGTLIYQSPAAKKMLGYDEDDTQGKHALSFFHPDDQADVVARLQYAIENPGLPIFRTNRMKHKDGHFIWTEGTTTNLLNDPNVKAFVGNFRDITERRTAWEKIENNERRLEAERKKYSDLFTQAPSYICILAGPDHVYEMANPLYLQITGKKDIIGKSAIEVFPELVEQGFVGLLDQIYNTGVPYAANEVLISIKNDETGNMVDHYMNFVYQPYKDEAGNIEGIFFFANVVTEQVAARQKIEQTEKYFRALVENADDIITLADGRGNLTYISPSFEKITGYSVSEMMGKSYTSFVHPDFVEESITFFRELMANPGVSMRRSGCFIHKNGSYIWLEGTAINLQHDENVGGVVSNLRDITQRRQAEEKIEHANRMFSFLSHINQAIVHLADDKQLFKEACRIAFEIGKFRMAWIGLLDNENSILNLVESMGMPDEDIPLFTNVVYGPDGGVGHLLRTKASVVCNNVKNAPGIKQWHQYAANRQLKAFMMLPLKLHGEIIATFNLFACDEDFFDKQEVALLEEVANDISFALDVFEKERVRKEMEAKVQHNELRLKQAQSIAHIGSWDYDFVTGKVIWSEEACRIYGIDPDKNELNEDDWQVFCHPDDLQDMRNTIENAQLSLVDFAHNHRIILADGTLKHIFSESHFEFDSTGNLTGIHGIIHDVSAKKEAEEKIINANRLYAFISQVNQTIVQVTNEDALFKAVCNIAIEQGKFDLAWISMPDPQERNLNVVAHCNATESDIALLNRIRFRDDGPIARVMNTGRLFVINDFSTDDVAAEFKNYAATRGFRSCIILPITKGGKTIGAYNLISTTPNLFDEEEIRLLTEATNDISFALGVFEKERERSLIEERLVHNERRFKQAQAIALVGSWELDLKTDIFTWAEETCRIYGIPLEENVFSFDRWLEYLHPDEKQEVLVVINKAAATYSSVAFHHRIVRKDGTIRHIFTEAHYEFNSNGRPVSLYGVCHDVTKTREAEEKIINVNRLYAFISAINQSIVQVTDEIDLYQSACDIAIKQGKFALAWINMPDRVKRKMNVLAHANANADDILLFENATYQADGPLAELLETGNIFVINDFLSEDVNQLYKDYAATRGFRSSIMLPLKKEGKTIAVYNLSSTKANLFDEEEIRLLTEATNDISFALDVFEKEKHRKEMEDKILQSEASLKNAQAMAHFGSWELDFATGVATWSEEACRIYGIPLKDNHSQNFDTWKARIHPEDLERVMHLIKEGEATLSRTAFNHKIVTDAGTVRYVFSESHYKMDMNRNPIGMRGVVHDITETREAEESLARSEENLRLIMDVIPQCIFVKNLEGKYLFVNKSLAAMHGFTPEEMVSRSAYDLPYANYDAESLINDDKEVILSSEMSIMPEQHIFDHNGNERLFYTIRLPFIVAGTNEKAVLGVAMDITDQKADEAEKAKIISDIVQRNKNLEQFSYIVSHNLRAPVANIMGLTDVLVDSSLEIDVKNELITDLSASVKKLDNVIMDLNYILQVKHTESKEKENVKLSEILSDIQLSVDNLIRSNDVKIVTDFSSVDQLFTLKSYLYSIIYNLVSNSIKYRRADEQPLLHIASKLNGNKVVLTFQDNGLGIDLMRRKDEVFGLYKRFHTHVSGKGMGLFMVKTQVESLGGTIAIESEINRGTTFTIELEIG